jgi:hypothetical protein
MPGEATASPLEGADPTHDPLTVGADSASAAGPATLLDDIDEVKDLVFEPGLSVNELQQIIAAENENRYGIGSVFVARPDPLEIDPAAELGKNIAGIRLPADTSLIDFARLTTKLTGVPIGFDADALAAAGLSAAAPVQVDFTDVTVHDMLTRVAQASRLAVVERGQAIVLVPADAGALVTRRYDIPVVEATDTKSIETFVTSIQTLIAPATWQLGGGEGTARFDQGQLVVEQIPVVHREIERLVEGLRLAHAAAQGSQSAAPPPAAAEGAPRLFAHTLLGQTAEARGRRSELSIMTPQPLDQVLGRLEQDTGLTLLVDWPAALDEGWNPNVLVPWQPADQATVADTLAELARSMNLTLRWVDPTTVEMTSSQVARQKLSIEVYSAATFVKAGRMSPEQVIAIVRSAIGGDLRDSPEAQVFYEPHSAAIVASLPQRLHFRLQRVLERLGGIEPTP